MGNVTLNLTTWQKRMVKDYLGKDASFISMPIEGGPIALYQALPTPPIGAKHAIMYLTDEQMVVVKDAFKVSTPCNHMEIGLDLPMTIG
jgi:hypothetical protein